MATRSNGSGDGGGARPGVLGCVTALVVVLGLLAGIAWLLLKDSGYWPGSSMTTAWEAPYDRNATEQGNRAWLVGDTVVRSRVDAVTGFDVRSGAKRWEYVPGRADICSTSATADGGVALIFYGEPRKGCDTLAALDLTRGRELWRTPRTLMGDTSTGDVMTVGAGLAVFRDERAHTVRAVDLRSGAPRWTAAVPKGCGPGRVAAAARHVLAVVACGGELKLAAFDPADGRERWTVPLDARRGVSTGADATFTSADPAVVRVGEPDGSAPYSYRVFGPDGRPQGVIDEVGGYGQLTGATVDHGRLVALATGDISRGDTFDRLVAFDLASGNELWRETVTGNFMDTAGWSAQDGRVTVLTTSYKYGDQFHVHDAATGHEEETRAFRDRLDRGGEILTYEDLVIAFRHGPGVRPFTVYARS
ncbi:PQQ-binding-like beta-propeller repeat protein [Streptomyces sp. NPDC051909]|uniref:outer membrane protein assembly factor BamB family protein n=1 Tax=Streptomyces sp. NPDC051909 TaxID=3154944 RepID=UPI00344918B5